MSVILGIDLGTSSVKAMLLDSVKGVISVESSPYEVSIPFEGYAEQNPETWWLETKQVLGRLRDKNEQEFNEIQAVGFSGQMHGIVVADCEGKPLRPAILWLDQRSRKELESINSVLDFREMGEIFRNRAFTGFAFPSLMWLKEHEPEVLLKAGAVLMPKDYIRFRMTGNLASDVTDASATALFDTAKRDWAFGIIKKFGLPEEIFPACKESMEVAGTVTRQCHEECGLKEGIPVVYGSGDQMAQSIGNGVFREGEVISNIGTGGQISAYDDIAVQHHIQAADCKCQVPQIILPDFRECRITETQLREKGGNISTGSPLQAVCGTVGFQTAPFSAIAEGTIGIDAHMFDGTTVHTQAVMYFSVQYDGAAQILVQQNNNGITEFFLMPGLQITGSLGVVLQTAGVGNMAGKIRKLHTRMVQYSAIADRRAVSGDQTLDRDCGPQDPAWGKRVFSVKAFTFCPTCSQ